MTLEEAVARVESLANEPGPWDPNVPTPLDRRALRIVLAAAKRPRVYALGEEERKALRSLIGPNGGICVSDDTPINDAVAALTAALALEQPEEPRVTIEYRDRAKPKIVYSDEYLERVKRGQAEPEEEPFTLDELDAMIWDHNSMPLNQQGEQSLWRAEQKLEAMRDRLRAYIEKKEKE